MENGKADNYEAVLQKMTEGHKAATVFSAVGEALGISTKVGLIGLTMAAAAIAISYGWDKNEFKEISEELFDVILECRRLDDEKKKTTDKND
jgi:hypothetical protein|tara:strand:- start:452 stop:727 length:276 start_codon:yes stop_codon:yes gene_type:complete